MTKNCLRHVHYSSTLVLADLGSFIGEFGTYMYIEFTTETVGLFSVSSCFGDEGRFMYVQATF